MKSSIIKLKTKIFGDISSQITSSQLFKERLWFADGDIEQINLNLNAEVNIQVENQLKSYLEKEKNLVLSNISTLIFFVLSLKINIFNYH